MKILLVYLSDEKTTVISIICVSTERLQILQVIFKFSGILHFSSWHSKLRVIAVLPSLVCPITPSHDFITLFIIVHILLTSNKIYFYAFATSTHHFFNNYTLDSYLII